MGGEPERDEGGLPPVDVVIPDDARELDRDVQAYHRELRARRRRRRVQRFLAPFTGHGMVIPLIAATLAVTLFAGTMLTVITSAPEPNTPLPRSASAPAAQPTPSPGQLGGPLPDAAVLIGNKPSQLRDLAPSVLAVVPPGCACLAALRQLTGQAVAARISVYFVGSGGGIKQVAKFAVQAGRGFVQVVNDTENVLRIYHPTGLTAILVHSDSAVTFVARRLNPALRLQSQLQQLGAPALGYAYSQAPR